MYELWYDRYLPGFGDSHSPYHQSVVIKVDRSLHLTRATSLSDSQICDWVQRDEGDYLMRAMCVKLYRYPWW